LPCLDNWFTNGMEIWEKSHNFPFCPSPNSWNQTHSLTLPKANTNFKVSTVISSKILYFLP
jgi:hypothetical protein